jgi:hypothetical protein
MDAMLRAIAPALVASALLGAALALAANGAAIPGGALIALYGLLVCGLGAWAAALGARRRTGGGRRG